MPSRGQGGQDVGILDLATGHGLCLLIVLGVALVLVLPMLLTNCPQGHDIRHHLIFSHHFTEQFWQGELYPRWLQKMNAGFGSPTFFYAPLPFWITALLSAPFWIDKVTGYPLILSCSLALLGSGIAAYYWLQAQAPRRLALLLALLYMALPYHLLVDLYMRFAFAEFWSFVWLPLIFLFARRQAQGAPGAGCWLALVLALQVSGSGYSGSRDENPGRHHRNSGRLAPMQVSVRDGNSRHRSARPVLLIAKMRGISLRCAVIVSVRLSTPAPQAVARSDPAPDLPAPAAPRAALFAPPPPARGTRRPA